MKYGTKSQERGDQFSNGNAEGITELRTIPTLLLLLTHQSILEIFSQFHQ